MLMSRNKVPDRIPYDDWIHSQFSVARYYGACTINGYRYECDYDNCKTVVNDKGETMYFPDLVRVISERNKKKDR